MINLIRSSRNDLENLLQAMKMNRTPDRQRRYWFWGNSQVRINLSEPPYRRSQEILSEFLNLLTTLEFRSFETRPREWYNFLQPMKMNGIPERQRGFLFWDCQVRPYLSGYFLTHVDRKFFQGSTTATHESRSLEKRPQECYKRRRWIGYLKRLQRGNSPESTRFVYICCNLRQCFQRGNATRMEQVRPEWCSE